MGAAKILVGAWVSREVVDLIRVFVRVCGAGGAPTGFSSIRVVAGAPARLPAPDILQGMATAASSPPPQPVVLSYEDLRGLPEDGRRYEIFEGELQATPSPSIAHQRISRNLEFLLHAHVVERELGEVFYAPCDVILDRTTVVEPDLLFVAAARRAIIRERGIEGPPDLVVEILSPSTEQRDRGAKQQIYARYGVVHYWRVDGAAHTLTELVLRGDNYALRATHSPETPFRSALFPELTIDLAQVFRDTGP
jgi:Uma2 family endonuclease